MLRAGQGDPDDQRGEVAFVTDLAAMYEKLVANGVKVLLPLDASGGSFESRIRTAMSSGSSGDDQTSTARRKNPTYAGAYTFGNRSRAGPCRGALAYRRHRRADRRPPRSRPHAGRRAGPRAPLRRHPHQRADRQDGECRRDETGKGKPFTAKHVAIARANHKIRAPRTVAVQAGEISVKQAADELGIPADAVYNWPAHGQVPDRRGPARGSLGWIDSTSWWLDQYLCRSGEPDGGQKATGK